MAFLSPRFARGGEEDWAILADGNIILDAQPAEIRDVDPWLDAADHAFLQRPNRARIQERDELMVAQPDPMPGDVDKILAQADLFR